MKQQEHNSVSTNINTPRDPAINDGQIPASPTGSANKWAIMSVAAVGTFMATLDTSIVNISLPAIAHNFNVPLNGAIEWSVQLAVDCLPR
jgi:hypothetical protein